MVYRHYYGAGSTAASLRAKDILRRLNLRHNGLERIPGASNEVWIAGDYILRVSPLSMTTRLLSEAALLDWLPEETLRPGLVAFGREAYGNWIVVERRPGQMVNDIWADLDEDERRGIVFQIAHALRAVHSTRVPFHAEWPLDPPQSIESFAQYPSFLSVERIVELFHYAASLRHVNQDIIGQAIDAVTSRRGAFNDRPADFGVVHGDFHFENVLVDKGTVTALVDFEWACTGPPDVDLDVMMRFCMSPELHSGSGKSPQPGSLRRVPTWLAEAYPEMFAHPKLRDRLIVYSLAYDARHLVRNPPRVDMRLDSPLAPLNRISQTLKGNHHLQLLPG